MIESFVCYYYPMTAMYHPSANERFDDDLYSLILFGMENGMDEK